MSARAEARGQARPGQSDLNDSDGPCCGLCRPRPVPGARPDPDRVTSDVMEKAGEAPDKEITSHTKMHSGMSD